MSDKETSIKLGKSPSYITVYRRQHNLPVEKYPAHEVVKIIRNHAEEAYKLRCELRDIYYHLKSLRLLSAFSCFVQAKGLYKSDRSLASVFSYVLIHQNTKLAGVKLMDTYRTLLAYYEEFRLEKKF